MNVPFIEEVLKIYYLAIPILNFFNFPSLLIIKGLTIWTSEFSLDAIYQPQNRKKQNTKITTY